MPILGGTGSMVRLIASERRAADRRRRFPQGLTLLKGDGQFPGEDTVIKEQSFVLILLYPYDTRDEGARHIERIRALYQEEFEQRSVLRVDHAFIVWVSF